MLIVNADDWGLDTRTTDAAADCFSRGRISAVSAMVFMGDSVRAAAIARQTGIDTGLHLNLTDAYRSTRVPESIRQAQAKVIRFLTSSKLSSVVYNPQLRSAFRVTVSAQIDEFRRLYRDSPSHLDGHHHQHLSANVLFGGLLPAGTIVRRHFTYFAGEKAWYKRAYRALCDRYLSRRCTILDGFFDLAEYVGPQGLQRLSRLADSAVIEIMTHPAQIADYRYLTGREFGDWLAANRLTSFKSMSPAAAPAPASV